MSNPSPVLSVSVSIPLQLLSDRATKMRPREFTYAMDEIISWLASTPSNHFIARELRNTQRLLLAGSADAKQLIERVIMLMRPLEIMMITYRCADATRQHYG